MNKRALIAAFVTVFEKESKILEESARAAHEAATHEESQAEDAHDTRGIEASYLAAGQATRIAALQAQILEFRLMIDSFGDRRAETAAVGAVVELQPLQDDQPRGRASTYLIAASGGGASVEFEGRTVNVLSIASPLGEAVVGARAGEEIELEAKGGNRSFHVLSVS